MRPHARWLPVLRALVLRAALPASVTACSARLSDPGSCPADQSLPAGARDATGALIPTAVAAQCASPGLAGTSCMAPVLCVSSTQSCCGQMECAAATTADGSAASYYVWVNRACGGGPLAPPELAAPEGCSPARV